MKNLAIITARGGSKRMPRKNIKIFIDKPNMAYSIKAATSSIIVDEVMVSTEDDEIAEIAQQNGASIPFKRSSTNSDDFATASDVSKEVLHCYQKESKSFYYVGCIYPTAPFVNKNI
ncbi:MAG: hypothetical protein WBP08_08500 [Saprospiraceae bacterium]